MMECKSRGRCKRTALLVVAVLTVLLFSGCIDIVHYISGSSSDIDVYFRLTLQKSIFELASTMGSDPGDLDQMFADFELSEDEVLADLPPGVDANFTPVSSDMEFGFELQYSASRRVLESMPDGEGYFVPRISSRGMFIPLSEGNGGESDEFSDAIMGSAKYRLMISRRLVSRIREARLLAGDESTPITVTQLPDIWLLEFPTSLWYGSEAAPMIQIIF